MALTGWRSALERWRSVGQTAELGRNEARVVNLVTQAVWVSRITVARNHAMGVTSRAESYVPVRFFYN